MNYSVLILLLLVIFLNIRRRRKITAIISVINRRKREKVSGKMEEAAKKTEGVKDATVNFMMLKMIVEFEEGADEKKVMKQVLKNCRKVEDDCEIFF